MRHVAPCVVLALALPALLPAQKLKVGDPAPALSIEKWVKGDPVESFEKGKVYVVEFWATWCGPCIASMPHLSEIQKHYRKDGLTVIGVTSPDRSNTLDKVEAMVEEKGSGMGYTVAWDKDRETNAAYMDAAGQRGIPCSFLIDKAGEIAYIGHPMFLEIPIEAVMAGDASAEEVAKKAEVAEKRLNEAFAGEEDPVATLAKVDALLKDYPSLAGMLAEARYGLLVQAKQYDKAAVAGNAIVDKAIAAKDPMALNQIAWGIVDPEADLEKRDLDLAMKAAKAAVELTEEKDGAILDTLARVYARKGDYETAISWQQKAVALDESMQPALDEYREALAKQKSKQQGEKKTDQDGK